MKTLKKKYLVACAESCLSDQPRISRNVKDAIAHLQEPPIPVSGMKPVAEALYAMFVKAGIPKPNVRSGFFLAKVGQTNPYSVGWAILRSEQRGQSPKK